MLICLSFVEIFTVNFLFCLLRLVALLCFSSELFFQKKNHTSLLVLLWLVGQDTNERLIVEHASVSGTNLSTHALPLSLTERSTVSGQGMLQLLTLDETGLLEVPALEGISQHLLWIGVSELGRQDGDELCELDEATSRRIALIDHLLNLRRCLVHGQRGKRLLQILDGDSTVLVLIKVGEGILELFDLLIGEGLCVAIDC